MLSTFGPTPTSWNQTMGGFDLFAFSLFTWMMVWICSTDFYDKGYWFYQSNHLRTKADYVFKRWNWKWGIWTLSHQTGLIFSPKGIHRTVTSILCSTKCMPHESWSHKLANILRFLIALTCYLSQQNGLLTYRSLHTLLTDSPVTLRSHPDFCRNQRAVWQPHPSFQCTPLLHHWKVQIIFLLGCGHTPEEPHCSWLKWVFYPLDNVFSRWI